MKKKGFTLIELLAVIVILAIIALIATPLVLKYIEKSRKESKVDSAYSFVRNLETEIANYSIKHNGKKYNGQPSDKGYYELDSFNGSEIDTTVKGDKPNSIKVCLSSLGQVDKAMFEYGKYYVSYDGKKGSISDEATYSSFNCSGNVAGGGTGNGGDNTGGDDNGNNNGETVFKGNINFSEDTGYYGLIDNCLDPEKFISGEYYDVVLTDEDGESYTHRLLAQNQIVEVTSVDEQLPIVLSSPKSQIAYAHVKSENMCILANDFDAEGNPLYNGEYQMEVKSTNQKTNPNYVFRISKYYRSDYYNGVEFYSSDLKVGDKVVVELSSDDTTKTFSGLVGENANETEKLIYSKQTFKHFSDDYDSSLPVPANVKILINDKIVYQFKKEDFTFVNNPNKKKVGLGCVDSTYYYVGNDDIDYVNGC